MLRVAITGGIGEGKSTVLGYLGEMGFPIASADRIAREVFLDRNIQELLAALLGVSAPVAPETLREALADPDIRREVNAMTHPRILAGIRSIAEGFVEVPLLVEACLQGDFDRVWVVTCGPDEQFARIAARVGPAEARSLIQAQLPTRAKIPFADRLVRTNEPESHVMRSVSLAAQRDLR